ncbi:MAG: porin family protein [Sporomusaceae bacterium]|nr:porin family protein [Sporomusaceae bacterium]
MKKKIALLTACLFLMSSAAFAAPLTDYESGKASIDLMVRSSKNTLSFADFDFDSKYNWEPSVTVGIADKWALQYRNLNAKSGATDSSGYVIGIPYYGKATAKLQASEFNVLYSLTPQVSAFIGYVSAKGNIYAENYIGPNIDASSSRTNTWQVGVLGNAPLAEKVSAYGVFGAGSKWLNYEIGLSYAFTENVEFNVDYRYVKAKDLDEVDFRTKGFGFGVTYKFN